jgi:hypothetical protein
MPKPSVINESELELDDNQLTDLLQTTDTDQRSDDWFEERLGKVTASKVKEVVARNSYGKPYQGYYDYLIELAIERVTGNRKRFSSRYTDHGNEYEAYIAGLYEEMYPNRDVRECGFIEHPTMAAGASPDRLVDDDGTIEVKAPNTDTMIKYMISMLPVDDPDHDLVGMLGLRGDEWRYYYDQIQWQLFVTGRQWCDFTVGDPDMTENAQIIVKRVPRDNEYINEKMLPRVTEFLEKVGRLERYLREYRLEQPA